METIEIKQIFEDARSRVTLSCNEYHPHTALKSCFRGDSRDVAICKLCEVILHDRAELVGIVRNWDAML